MAMVEALSKVDPPIDLLNLLDKSGNNPLYYCPSLEEKHVQRIKANHSKLIAGKLKEVAKRVRDDATLPKDRHDKPKM